MEQLLLNALMYVLVPIWLLAGLADWYLHRRSRIEVTSGLRESLLHILMLFEIGVPVLAILFLQINAAIFILSVIALIAHEATALWDVSYAQQKRYLAPIEQHVHSFLELIPMVSLLIISVLHWPQFHALIFADSSIADFSLKWKETPLPPLYLGTVLTAVMLLQALPYAEEAWRCLTASEQQRAID